MSFVIGGILRLLQILWVLLHHGLAHLLGTRFAAWPWVRRHFPSASKPGPERLRILLEDLGGTSIKFGQMLALQPDILSLEYCNALFDLMDRINPFPFDDVERIFTEEIGRKPHEIFDEVDRKPLATASIGQVHIAYLHGQKVVVKIQRPNVETNFTGDLRLMAAALTVIRRFHLKPLYWMIEPLDEFIHWTREELDFSNEARYMTQLRENCRDNSSERVPAVFWEYTTRRTIVLEFLDGVTLLDCLRAREDGDEVTLNRLRLANFNPDRFARNIIDNFLGDAFRYGMFHSDLHPANLMIQSDNVVGYVDFGITGILSPYSRKHLISMTLDYTRGNLEGMTEAFFRVSALNPNSRPEEFRDGMQRMADDWYERAGRERRLRKNFTLVMLDMLNLSRDTGILPERDVIKYIRSAIAIDGLITRFAPEFDVGRYLETVCGRYLRWQALAGSVAYDNLLAWSTAGVRMSLDGMARSNKLLDRLVSGEFPIRAQIGSGEHDGERNLLRTRAVQLAGMAFALSLIMTLSQEQAVLGFNLFTAELLLILTALTMLLPTLRRLGE